MEVKEALLKRRSCRKYLDKKVDKEIILELMKAAMSGPSARNKQPWAFYVITDEGKLEQLRGVAPSFNFNSTCHIVVCGDMSKRITTKPEDFWIQDCSAAIENILLRATSLGLGTCWCGVFPVEERINGVKEILSLGDNYMPLGLIHVGYPDCDLEERTQYDENCVFYI